MSDPAISTTGLTRDFGAVRALDGLSLDVPSGAIFGYLGPNGSGKTTTTINLLLGLLEPTGGTAAVLGFDTRDGGALIRANTGAVLEHPGVYEELTAEENLEFYGQVWHMERALFEARVHELLGTLGLWERRHERVEGWSRGMRQKLALARAMLHQPALLFLDEPTAGLDVMASTAVRDSLAALVASEDVTIFLTTHDMAEAERLCASVAVIRAGRVIAQGSPDDLRARTAAPRLEIIGRGFGEGLTAELRARPEVESVASADGHLDIDLREDVDPAPLVSPIVASGAQVTEVRRSQASLEDVFVTLMTETPS
jgi:ABC-2 type transport system ATP-binding protein